MDPDRPMYSLGKLYHAMMDVFAYTGIHVVLHDRVNHPALLEKYDKTVRDGLSKVCNVNFDDISSPDSASQWNKIFMLHLIIM